LHTLLAPVAVTYHRFLQQVIKAKGAILLIDDSAENAMVCASSGIHVLLFGNYPWGTRHSTTTGPLDLLSRADRVKAGDHGFWEREVLETLPKTVRRVGGWPDVTAWAKREAEGLPSKALEDDIEKLGETMS